MAGRASSRGQGGVSLIEVLVTTLIICVASAGLVGMLTINSMSTIRLANKVDGLNAARGVVERISRDVRMARHVGDIYTLKADHFPSLSNPIYTLGGFMPPGGWPTGWTNPVTLSNRCLILQIPVFYEEPSQPGSSYPSAIRANSVTVGTPAQDVENLDTWIYNVVADPSGDGTYQLQVCCCPGWVQQVYAGAEISTTKKYPGSSQVLLKGITNPDVFQYLDKSDTTGTPLNGMLDTAPNITDVDNVTAVIVHVQVLNKESGEMAPSNVGLKAEIYMRNNPIATNSG